MDGYGFLRNIFLSVNADIFSAVAAAAVFAFWTTDIFLAVFKTGYAFKKRAAYFLVLLFAVSALKTRAEMLSETDISALFFGAGALLFIPFIFIRVKERNDFAGRALVKYIDGELSKNADGFKGCGEPAEEHCRGFSATERAKTAEKPDITVNTENREFSAIPENSEDRDKASNEKTETAELDFSHVKTVITRLNASELSLADRRQVRQLEYYIAQAENGYPLKEIRPRINELLGILLKIMAKHGE